MMLSEAAFCDLDGCVTCLPACIAPLICTVILLVLLLVALTVLVDCIYVAPLTIISKSDGVGYANFSFLHMHICLCVGASCVRVGCSPNWCGYLWRVGKCVSVPGVSQ